MQPRTPIFIVTSSRPRVGKTLIARALIEYFCAQNRLVQAFDVNPGDFTLLDYLPACTAATSILDTRGEMALFDQLIASDGVPKVVDLAHGQLERFFAVIQQINFAAEARRRDVIPIVLFIADADDRARKGYAMLSERFADFALVPVLNEATPRIANFRENYPPTRRGGSPLGIPALSPVVRSVVDRPKVSLVAYIVKAADPTTELYGWISHVFVGFRELEDRILQGRMQTELQYELAQHIGVPEDRPGSVNALQMRSGSGPAR
jgi:hypothetical protein